MKIEIISSIVAFVGILISVMVTYFSTKKQIKTEIKKVHVAIEQNYLKMIIAKRIEIYPKIYYELHEFMRLIIDHDPTLDELKNFEKKLAELNSLYAVFISARTSDIYYRLRRYLYMIINKIKEKGQNKIESEDRKYVLHKHIQKIEIGLKKDLGIYLIEFHDAEGNLKISEEYDELKKLISDNK